MPPFAYHLRGIPQKRECWASEHLRFVLEKLDEFRYCGSALSDDASGRTIRRKLHRLYGDANASELRRLRLERLLLRRHDALERWITRPRDAFVYRDDGWQREFNDLSGSFDFAARGSFAACDLDLGGRCYARDAEQLGRRRSNHACRCIESVLAEENQIEAACVQLGSQRLGNGKAIKDRCVRLEVDGAIGAHAHGFAQRLVDGIRTNREDDCLPRSLFLIEL